MLNFLKHNFPNTRNSLNIAIALIMIIAGSQVWHGLAHASISSFTIAPTVDGTDNVVAYEGDYDVSYSTDSTGTVSSITVTFPSDYSLSPAFIHDPSIFVQSDAATGGYISINGVDQQITGAEPTGQDLVISLATPFDYNSTPGAPDTVSFRILRQVTNTTVARVVPAAEYSVDDDATGNDPQTAGADVTIIPGPAFTLDFTTLPSMSRPPVAGDVQSGDQWDIQPVVTAHDRYGNVATGYNDSVMLSLGSGVGTFVPATAFSFCAGPADTYIVTATNGVADFTPASATYIATADHEQFTLLATHQCGSDGGSIGGPGETSLLTADVVASSFEWTVEPADCTSGSACATQGVITAQDTEMVGLTPYTATDLDFAEEVTLGTDGAGTFLGEALQSAWVNGVLTTVGLGYTLVDPTVPEEVFFFVQASRISQSFTNGTTVAVAPVSPPPPPPSPTPSPSSPSGAGVYNPNPSEIPGAGIVAVVPPSATPNTPPITDGSCTPYLTAYLRFGDRGEQVSRLQTFLARQGSYAEGFITGFFGVLTERAVNAFQIRYASDILTPQGLTTPTGFARDYTGRKINNLICSGEVQL